MEVIDVPVLFYKEETAAWCLYLCRLEDIEAQLLKPGNMDGVNSIKQVKPETVCGIQNIKHVFHTTHSSNALDAAVSICTVAPGQS